MKILAANAALADRLVWCGYLTRCGKEVAQDIVNRLFPIAITVNTVEQRNDALIMVGTSVGDITHVVELVYGVKGYTLYNAYERAHNLRNRHTACEYHVIYICHDDPLGENLQYYNIGSANNETGVQYSDGNHYIFLNYSARDISTPIGQLLHDLFTRDINTMYSQILKEYLSFVRSDLVSGSCDYYDISKWILLDVCQQRDKALMQRDILRRLQNGELLTSVAVSCGMSVKELEDFIYA